MTVNEISQAVLDWLDRTDLAAIIPTWLKFVKYDVERNYNLKYMRTYYSPTVNAYTIALPTSYKDVDSVRILDSSGKRYPMKKDSIDHAWSLYPNQSGDTGTPAIISETVLSSGRTFVVRPTPDATFTLDMVYFAYSSDLSDSHWLVQNAPDLLIYGSLVKAIPYLGEDVTFASIWQTEYTTILSNLVTSENHEKFNGSPQRAMPYGDIV